MVAPTDGIEKLLESRAALIDREIGLISYALEPPELAEIVRYALKQRGKKVRATLLTLACEAVGGSLEKALVPAMVVEMIHNTSLIMDDVIDASDTRRGQRTINSRWGNNMALVACDALLALAMRQAARSDARLTSAIIECATTSLLSLAEGEAMELVRHDLSAADYFRIAERKTASLFGAAAEVGALVGSGTRKEVAALRRYGNDVGVAFQIRDDVLDVQAGTDVSGKPELSDLRMGRPNLVLLLAREQGLDRDRLLSLPRDELRQALRPAVAEAEAQARERIGSARRHLAPIRDGPAKKYLLDLGDLTLSRPK